MGQPSFEKLEVYQLADELADKVWVFVRRWSNFAQDTLGKQFVRAADSIGLNLAEGYGRGSYTDNKRHVYVARGSLNETIACVTRAKNRGLLTPVEAEDLNQIVAKLGPKLSNYLNYLT